jgi:hypothetical protein
MKLMKVFSLFMVLSFLSLNLFGQSAQTIKLDLEETKERKFNFSQAAHDFNLGADMVILIDNYDEKKDIKITISSIWDKIELKKDNILKSELIDPQTKKNTIISKFYDPKIKKIKISIDPEGRAKEFANIFIGIPFKVEVQYPDENGTYQCTVSGIIGKGTVLNKMPFYDARALDLAFKTQDERLAKLILFKYKKDINVSEFEEFTLSEFQSYGNPFINPFIDPIIAQLEKDKKEIGPEKEKVYDVEGFAEERKSALTGTEAAEKTSSTALKGFSVTNLADGMAKFLVERAKEELTIAFFRKFKTEFGGKKDVYEVLRTVFPNTYGVLQTIDEEIYNYSSYLQVLRDAFEKDLSNIYTNLPQVLEIGKIKIFFSDKIWLKETLKTGFYIIEGLKKEKHPGDILADFDTTKLGYDQSKNLENAIKLLKIISGSLRAKKSGGSYWLHIDSLKELFKEDKEKSNRFIVFEIYLGLIYQQALSEDIKFKINGQDKVFAAEVLGKVKESLDKIKDMMDKIDKFVSRLYLVETSLTDLKNIKDDKQKPAFDDYYKVYDAALGTLEYSLDFFDYSLEIINGKEKEVENKKAITNSKIKGYLDIARKLGDIYLDIKRRNYSQVVFNVIRVADSILLLNSNSDIETLTAELYELKIKEKNGVLSNDDEKRRKELKNGLKKLSEYKKIRNKFLKYGAFMAAVAKAESSDEVKKAIEAAALPAGSYRIKRTRSFTISLNSYVGLFGNKERCRMTEDNTRIKIKNLAVTAPIGLAFNIGLTSKEKYVSSLSIFASIIDLGAVVRYRFTEEEKGLSEVTWKDIFAPGAFLIFGPKNFPVSLGFGVQYGPRLTKVNESGDIETLKNSRIRCGLMIAVDIPLIHFK